MVLDTIKFQLLRHDNQQQIAFYYSKFRQSVNQIRRSHLDISPLLNQSLKNDEMYMDIPILVMSSKAKEQALEKLRAFNIDGYIQKDLFNQNDFIDTVKLILSKNHN